MAKDWLSSHGYPPTMDGAYQAYDDYLNGKYDSNGNEIPQTEPESQRESETTETKKPNGTKGTKEKEEPKSKKALEKEATEKEAQGGDDSILKDQAVNMAETDKIGPEKEIANETETEKETLRQTETAVTEAKEPETAQTENQTEVVETMKKSAGNTALIVGAAGVALVGIIGVIMVRKKRKSNK